MLAIKFTRAERFTKAVENPEELININCISYGFYQLQQKVQGQVQVHLTFFQFISFGSQQAYFKWLRNQKNVGGVVQILTVKSQTILIFFNIGRFVYLSTMLFLSSPIVKSIIIPVLLAHEEVAIQYKKLLTLLILIVLKGVCWYESLETLLGHLMEPPATMIKFEIIHTLYILVELKSILWQ